jgi:putrescine aminotransferase
MEHATLSGTAVAHANAPRRLIRLRQALDADREEVIGQHVRHLSSRAMKLYQFIGLNQIPVRALGPHFWDASGRRYTDVLSSFGTVNYGHNHPRLTAALNEVIEYPNLVEGPSALAGALASNLASLVPGLERVYFANSGTEAVDAAIKMVRAATGRKVLVACRGAFHGRSLGALSLMDKRHYREPFEPLLNARFVDFGDAAQLADALRPGDAAGFITEPFQGEAGMIAAPDGYLAEARRLCARHGALLVFDEIQSGLGRTGKLFAADHDRVVADCVLIGKALGGGIVPLSALLTTDALWQASGGNGPGSPFHCSTYGGNSRSCAVGLAGLELLFDEGLVERSATMGAYLIERLRELQARQPLIADVRGRGLMIGVELRPPARLQSIAGMFGRNLEESDSRHLFCGLVLKRLIEEHGMVTAITLNKADVLRVQPPLNAEQEVLDSFVDALDETLRSVSRFGRSVLRALPDIVRLFMPGNFAASYE